MTHYAAKWMTHKPSIRPIYPTRLYGPFSVLPPTHSSPTQCRSSGETAATRPPGNLCSSVDPLLFLGTGFIVSFEVLSFSPPKFPSTISFCNNQTAVAGAAAGGAHSVEVVPCLVIVFFFSIGNSATTFFFWYFGELGVDNLVEFLCI